MYKTVQYYWTTHKPLGLSAKDTQMARFCDEKAVHLGHVDAESHPDEEGPKG